MKRMRLMGLAAVAIFAMAVASAAAQPVFYGVAEVGKTVAPVKIGGTTGIAFLEGHTSHAKIECKSGTFGGEVNGATTTANNVTHFKECEASGLKCHSTSPVGVEGEIITKSLEGVLGNVSATLPGIRLFGPGESGKEPKKGLLALFECGGGLVKAEVFGSLIGTLSGAQGKTAEEGKFAASSKLTFSQTAGIQKYTKFLAGECGGAGNCGPEQLTSVINGTEELGGQSVTATIKSEPFASKLGFTK